MSTSASDAAGSPSQRSPPRTGGRVSINALLNPQDAEPRSYSSSSYSPRQASSYVRHYEYQDSHSTVRPSSYHQYDDRYRVDHGQAPTQHESCSRSRSGVNPPYGVYQRRDSSSEQSASPEPSSSSSYRQQRFPSVSSASSSVSHSRYYQSGELDSQASSRNLELNPAAHYPYAHSQPPGSHQLPTRLHHQHSGYGPSPSGSHNPRRPPRPKYNEEEMYFIWYHRVDLGQEWKDVRAKFNVQFPSRQRRGFQGIQCKYYRFTKEKGCPTLRDQGRRRNSGGERPVSVADSTGSEPESTPEYGVVHWTGVSYPWMRDEHRRRDQEIHNATRGMTDDRGDDD